MSVLGDLFVHVIYSKSQRGCHVYWNTCARKSWPFAQRLRPRLPQRPRTAASQCPRAISVGSLHSQRSKSQRLKKQKVAPEDRRESLYKYELPAKQMLNPCGPNSLNDKSLAQLWSSVAHGNDSIKFYSELAAGEDSGGPYRVGVGISRFCETLLAGIAELEKDRLRSLLKAEIWAKVEAEIKELKGPLKVVYAGQGSQKNYVQSLKTFAQSSSALATGVAEPLRSEAEVKAAAGKIYDWLYKPDSHLRGLLTALSAAGAVYAANVSEKVARAAVAKKPMDKATWQEAAWARRANMPEKGEMVCPPTSFIFQQ